MANASKETVETVSGFGVRLDTGLKPRCERESGKLTHHAKLAARFWHGPVTRPNFTSQAFLSALRVFVVHGFRRLYHHGGTENTEGAPRRISN